LIEAMIEVATAAEVAKRLRELAPWVKAADCVTSPYDIIGEVQAETVDEVGSQVSEIYLVPGIYRVVT